MAGGWMGAGSGEIVRPLGSGVYAGQAVSSQV